MSQQGDSSWIPSKCRYINLYPAQGGLDVFDRQVRLGTFPFIGLLARSQESFNETETIVITLNGAFRGATNFFFTFVRRLTDERGIEG